MEGVSIEVRDPRPEVRGAGGRESRPERKIREAVKAKLGKNVKIYSAKDLDAYQLAYSLAMEIFRLSKKWPAEEKYSLTDQVRRSSRSVCANLREAWAKRRYEAHFLSKLSDCDGENSETDTWLDFAKDGGYLSVNDHKQLVTDCKRVGAMLGALLKNPTPFLMNPRT